MLKTRSFERLLIEDLHEIHLIKTDLEKNAENGIKSNNHQNKMLLIFRALCYWFAEILIW
jgi:hypothetical protein